MAKEKSASKHAPASGNVAFTDEEMLALEQRLIDAYLCSDVKPIRVLLRIYCRFWRELLISMLFYVIKSSPVLVLPIVTSNIINTVIYEAPDRVLPHLLINIGVIVFLLLLNIPTHMLYIRYHSLVVRRVEAGLRGAMVRKLQQLSITFHQEMQSGRIQSKLMRDVETVQALSDQIFANIPGIVLNTLTALVVVIYSNFTMFWFFLLCIPASVFLVRMFRGRIAHRNHEYRKNMETASASLMDMVEMTQITRAHALEEEEIKKMTDRLNAVANTGFRLDVVQALFASCSWVTSNLFQLVCLVFSAYMALRGQIQFGDITLYQSYFSTLTGQVSAIIGMLPVITKGIESLRSIGEILNNSDVEDNEGKTVLKSLCGEYDFQNVQFQYQAGQPLLQGFDLHVKAGETIAIVGESGSGKTTLLNLVIGFHFAQEGRVLVDSQDMRSLDLRSYRRHVAIVPQSSVLFTGTIRENITYGLPQISEERLAQAVEAARLTAFIASLPNGLDTVLEEHGANLSGGQRQRLSIARALIRDPRVIILDEATSALDGISEKEIQQAIHNLTRQRTTFIVAHRLSTIRDADRIAVLQNGRCVELGSYEELMQKKGVFYRMQNVQCVK